MGSELLTPEQTAELLCVSPSWLEKRRRSGDGPTFLRVGGLVRYDRGDVNLWLDSRRVAQDLACSDTELRALTLAARAGVFIELDAVAGMVDLGPEVRDLFAADPALEKVTATLGDGRSAVLVGAADILSAITRHAARFSRLGVSGLAS
jgi:hypothetical protein